MLEEYQWVEKYRPRKVADTILPCDLKKTFQGFVDSGNIANMTLAGGPGVGKTTIARAMLDELGCDYIVINGSMNGNIDTLRNDILHFASSVSLSGGRKYVILDEADFLNCLHEEHEVLLSNGDTIKLKDMKDDTQYSVLSFNKDSNVFEEDKAWIVSRTQKETFEIELENGTKLRVTDDHPICVQDKDGNISFRTLKEGFDGYNIIVKY